MNDNRFQLGLKLWSPNTHLVKRVQELYEAGAISYLELYAAPHTYIETIKKWKQVEIPYVIHAPNESQFNLSDRTMRISNKDIYAEVRQFADELGAKFIIIHPGFGDFEECQEQLLALSDTRICIENMPYQSLYDQSILNGSTFAELEKLLTSSKYHFCLDVGHAIVAAHNLGIDFLPLLHQLLSLRPTIFHLNDGLTDSSHDNHLHFGEGNFPIKEILTIIPQGSMVSLENEKNLNGDLADFIADVAYIKSYKI